MSKKYFTYYQLSISLFLMLSFFLNKAIATDKDSLQKALHNAKHDTTMLEILGILIDIEEDIEIWPSYNRQMSAITEKNLSQKQSPYLKKLFLSYSADVLNNTGYFYSANGEVNKAIYYTLKGLKIQEQIGDKSGIATSYNNLGTMYDEQGHPNLAISCFYKALLIDKEINDVSGISYCYSNLGLAFDDMGNISKALEYHSQALKIRERIKDDLGIASTLNNIAMIHQNQGNMVMAIEYFYKALLIEERIHDKGGYVVTLNNLGSIFHEKGEYEKGLKYLHRALALAEKTNNFRGKAFTLNNLGACYYRVGKIPEAIDCFSKSLILREEIGDEQGIAITLINFAHVYMDEGHYKKAQNYAVKALSIAKRLDFPGNIMKAAEILYKIYKLEKKSDLALQMHELFVGMKDSISNKETRKASVKQELRYSYEKKEITLKAEQDKKELKYEHHNKRQFLIIITVCFGLFIVIIFSFFLYRRFKTSQIQKKIIEDQKKEVDAAYALLNEKNTSILDSIIYAKRIQMTLLTPESYFEKHLK